MRISFPILICAAILPAAAQTTALHCGTLIDVKAQRVLREQTVIVDKNRIARVEAGYATPAGATVIDLRNQACMPGWVDLHVHLTSQVSGRLRDGLGPIDVLRATLPAGTVSGAPKVRAMEIIDELEPVKRGIYAGAVGYLGFHGNMDVAIALRTGVIKGGKLHVQAGGGIVADSQPAAEWQETQSKARALLRAAEMAEGGLDTRVD